MPKSTEETKKKLLEGGLGGFYYEFSMMREGAILIMSCRIPNTNNIQAPNIMLVGFLTHIRNLYEFFYGSGEKGLAYAGHYIKSWKDKKPSPDIRELYVRLQVFLSHLSYARTTKKWEPYPIDSLYFHFRDLTIEFLSNFPEESLPEKLNNLLKELEKEKFKL